MRNSKIYQLQYQTDCWEKVLLSITEENIQLKYKLTCILQNRFSFSLLEELEQFQNLLIKEDQQLLILRNEIKELDKHFTPELLENGKMWQKLQKQMGKLRTQILNNEKEFARMKLNFNRNLTENTQDTITI